MYTQSIIKHLLSVAGCFISSRKKELKLYILAGLTLFSAVTYHRCNVLHITIVSWESRLLPLEGSTTVLLVVCEVKC